MIEKLLLDNLGAIGQNGAFLLIMGWVIMNVQALCKKTDKMSEAMNSKASKEMCEQKHSDLDKHMEDLKVGNRDILKKIDTLTTIMIEKAG